MQRRADGDRRPATNRIRLGRLVRDHRPSMVSFARTITPQMGGAAAEGIVQDALVLILDRPVTLPEADPDALAVVMGYIRNVALNRRRKDLVRQSEQLDARHAELRSDAWVEAWRIQARRDFEAAYEGLTPGERGVVRARLLGGRSFKEIADDRHCGVKSVKELYRRGRRKMRQELDARYGRPGACP